ncbi:protein of unknown function [Geodermatophilus telluris]|uniref:DUF4276 family protein n=1 Tax=Geodermatophilus telluris TaxID=1190417 RepID=A0A1G6PKD4_9ACTN|nr:protein of unknown function [Geodermatophilus telluris]
MADPQSPHVGLVVEGAGDRNALPVLLRAYLYSQGEYRDVLGKPVPCHGRDKAIVPNGIEGYTAVAGVRPGCVGVLVVLDGEGDCVAERGPELLERAVKNVAVPVRVALADCDFEDWLYSSAESLELGGLEYQSGKRGVSEIKRALRPRAYTKPVWQPRLAARMDVDVARARSASLARMLERFDELRAALP